MMSNFSRVRTAKCLCFASLSVALYGGAVWAQAPVSAWPQPAIPAKSTEPKATEPKTTERDAAMARLLNRLDSAPVQWEQVNVAARRADDVSKIASLVANTVAPVRPYLVMASKSQTLSAASHIPIVGTAARIAQDNLDNLVLLDQGFQRLTQADQRHLAPLRAAAQSAAKLQRTRSRVDVPAVARSFSAAAQILGEDENSLRAQRARLTQLKAMWPLIDSVASRYAPQGSLQRSTAAKAQGQLHAAVGMMDSRLERLSALRQWLKEGALDAQALSRF